MEQSENPNLEKWKSRLEKEWREIPKPYRNDHSVRRSLQCSLFSLLKESGYMVVADYMPPRIAERAIDLIALNEDMEIVYAFCIDSLVTLAAVKSLCSFPSIYKVVLTTGMLEKKVQESRFFLKPEIEHIHLQPFGKSF